jgi:hypothetical protein
MWPEHLLAGLYLERSGDPADPQADWRAFLGWLERVENAVWLGSLLHAQAGTIENPYRDEKSRGFNDCLTPSSDGKVFTLKSTGAVVEAGRLSGFLAELPAEAVLNLVIGKRLMKQEAVAQGTGVAKSLYDFFNLLMPVFESRAV